MHLAELTVPASRFAAEAPYTVGLFDAELDRGLIDAFLHWGYTAPCNLQVAGGLTRKQWDVVYAGVEELCDSSSFIRRLIL